MDFAARYMRRELEFRDLEAGGQQSLEGGRKAGRVPGNYEAVGPRPGVVLMGCKDGTGQL